MWLISKNVAQRGFFIEKFVKKKKIGPRFKWGFNEKIRKYKIRWYYKNVLLSLAAKYLKKKCVAIYVTTYYYQLRDYYFSESDFYIY